MAPTARVRSLVILVIALLGALAVFAVPALAGVPLNGGPAPLTGSNFQGADGNQKTPMPGDPDHVALPARTDWQNYATSPALSTLPDGTGLQDRWFFQGKEQEPDSWTFQQDTVSPGKADVLGAWSVTDPVSTNVFLYLAFYRAEAGGTTFYNFELNQLSSTWTNSQGTVVPCRKDGDIIISFELQGGAGDVGVQAWEWEHSQPGPAACPEGKVGTWTSTGALSTDEDGNTIAQGAMNSGPITNYLDFNNDGDGNPATNPSPTTFAGVDTFGEAALNLSKILSGINGGDSCFNFGQLQLHTRSSAPFTADLKDFIAPKPIVARSCAIEGTKYHDVNGNGSQDAGEQGLGNFRIYADANHNDQFDAGEPNTFTADGTQAGKPLGSWVLTNLPAGGYEIREDLTNTTNNPRATEGWTCTDPSTSDPAPASSTTACEFTVVLADGAVVGGLEFGNFKQPTIRVEKNLVPSGDPGRFDLKVDGATVKAAAGDEEGDTTTVTVGTHGVSETAAAGTALTDYNSSVACTKNGSAYLSGTGTDLGGIQVSSGDAVVCRITNTRKTGKLEVVKQLEPTTDTGTFDLRVDGVTEAAAVGDDGTTGEQTVDTGSHTVAEAGANGTSLDDYVTSLECKDGATVVPSAGGTVTVTEDADIVCTFTNKRKAKVTIVKDADPDGAQDFSFTTTLGAAFDLDDDGDGTLSDRRVFSGIGTFGAASVTEGLLADWTLTDITCNAAANLSRAGQVANITVDPGDDITCTFTNKKDATVTAIKDAQPNDAQDFAFTTSGLGAGFSLDDDGDATLSNEKTITVSGGGFGPKSVTEAATPGWSLTDLDCTGDAEFARAGATADLDVDPGETIVCTFENTKDAKVTIVKDADPADGTDFDYTGSFGAFKLDDGGADDATPTSTTFAVDGDDVGDKTVAESEKAGWTLTDIECSEAGTEDLSGTGGSVVLDVDPGDEITCTFVNTQDATVEIVKDADPADGTDFDYSGGLGEFRLDHEQDGQDEVEKSETFTVPAAGLGSIAVTEEAEAGWTLADITCTDDAALQKDLAGKGGTATIAVDAGDQITCTFFNKQDASVTVVKDAIPDGAQDFSFTTEGLGDGFKLDDDDDAGLADSETIAIDGDQVGAKSVTESAQPGWDLTGLDCTGDAGWQRDGATADLDVDPGEEITCTFENTKRGSVTVTKTEAGGTLAGEWTFRLTGGPDDVDLTQVATPQDATLDFGDLKPGTYTLCEVDMPIDWFSSLEDAPYFGDRVEENGKASVCIEIVVKPGEAVQIAVDNTRPETLVLKEGNVLVHDGDTITYTFDVSNKGNTALENVSIEDPKCDAAPVRDSANDANSDADALLEPAGTPDATKSEVWRFTCTKVLGAHADDEENPVVNVATAHAFDLQGNEVTDTDDHKTTIIHPGIAVNKELRRQGDGEWSDDEAGDPQVRVHVGDTIEYRFTVTNDGDTALTVEFDDPMCDSQATLSGDADADGDGKLGVSETWIYRCDHVVTEADGDPVVNTVEVTGTDVLGGPKGTVTDSDSESADVLHPDIEILKRVRLLPAGTLGKTASAHVGETVEYQLDVTDGDSDTPIQDVTVSDAICDAGTLSAPAKAGGDQDDLLEDGETWTYTCTRVITASDGDTVPNTATATGSDSLGREVEDEDSAEVTVLKPATLVVKEGAQFGYPGDTVTFTFAVTNTGNTPLTDIVVTDDKCAPVSATPTETQNDDGDAQLEKVGADGVNPEKWIFSCTKQIPADHAIGDENPIVNTATASGKDPSGKTVTDQDDHSLTVLHPAIDIEKTGPATATVGDTLTYLLTIRNTGDVPFPAANVVVTDPKCSQPPLLQGKGSDATPGSFDPADAWTYTCSAATTGMAPGTFVNTASVKGTDGNGRSVTDTDDFPTRLDAQQVLPEEVIPGTARLTGPSGCVKKAFKATVRGSRIAKVTFFVDGKKRKTITAETGQRAFKLNVRPNALGRGVHRVTARVRFVAESETKTRTLRLSFQRCARQVVRPQFTG